MTQFRVQKWLSTMLVLGVLLSPKVSAAQVLFNNGVPNNLDGEAVSGLELYADNVTLGSDAAVASFQWFALNAAGGPATNVASFDWKIFQDAAGHLGSLVAGTTTIGAIGTKTGYYCCGANRAYDVYSYDVDVGNLALAAGTYWLAIGNYSPPGVYGSFWAESAADGDNTYQSFDGGQTFASSDHKELAFFVSGPATVTPEPASVSLLITGLVGIYGATRRRRRAQRA